MSRSRGNRWKIITRRFIHTFVLNFLILCLPGYAQAPTGEISGRVVNARDNEPLALVQLELAGTSFRTVSADDGTFRLTGVPPGSYVLQTSSVNFYIVRMPLTVDSGEIRTVNVALAPSTTTVKESVVVAEDVFDVAPEPTAS